jgi:CBS-domain-containing membrane protein
MWTGHRFESTQEGEKTMIKAKRAGEVMIPLDKYPHMPYWFTLRQAIAEFEKSEFDIHGRKSLPRVVLIFNEAHELLGMARRRDILRGLEPEFLAMKPLDARKEMFDVKIDPNLSELSYDGLLEVIQKRAERQIHEVMLPIEATVDVDDHLIKVIYEMVDSNRSQLPVLKDGRVVGVVRSVDVFHEIALLLL